LLVFMLRFGLESKLTIKTFLVMKYKLMTSMLIASYTANYNMTFTNHLLTGATLAKVLPLPIAIPLAFASHFILDAVPHFGFKNIGSLEVRNNHKKLLASVILLDIILGISISIWLLASGHYRWLLVGLVAYSPDLLWIYRFIVEEKFGRLAPTEGNRFTKFHANIQKYERPWGGFIEVIYAASILLILI